MKNLALASLALLLLTLTACGAPFEAALFDDGASGAAGEQIGLGVAGSAGSDSARAGAPSAAAGGPSMAGGDAVGVGGTSGSAGAPPVSQGGGGLGGEGSAAGAPSTGGGGSGGAAGTAETGGTGGTSAAGAGGSPATTPPCDPSIQVPAGAYQKGLGPPGACLRVVEDFNYLQCTNWDNRIVKVNGVVTPCWVQFAVPTKIGGFNYLEITAGKSDMAWISWSVL